MTERTPAFDAAVEAYEAAQKKLLDLTEQPDKTVSVAAYRVLLARALRDQQAAHKAMMEAWV